MNPRTVVAVLLGGVGLVFTGQGLGLIPGSFMTGDLTWAVVGAVMIAIAVGLALRGRRSS